MSEEPADDPNEHILTPEELEIEDHEDLVDKGDGRYVVATNTETPTDELDHGEERLDSDRNPHDGSRPFADVDASYAIDADALTDGTTSSFRTASNDVVTVFGELLLWYAEQVGDDETPPDEVLEILLNEAGFL
jgi:hypothetical protein